MINVIACSIAFAGGLGIGLFFNRSSARDRIIELEMQNEILRSSNSKPGICEVFYPGE